MSQHALDQPHPDDRAAFDRSLAPLIGRAILGVTYLDTCFPEGDDPYDGDPPHGPRHWNDASETFDMLSEGVRLRLDDESIVTIYWCNDYFNHSVCVAAGPAEPGDVLASDVTERWRERGLLGTPIVSVHGTWERVVYTPLRGVGIGPGALPEHSASTDAAPEEIIWFPQDIRLRFGSGAVVTVATFRVYPDGSSMGMADHLSVFFDEAEADRRIYSG